MKLIIPLLLLATLAGCLGSNEPGDEPPGGTDGPDPGPSRPTPDGKDPGQNETPSQPTIDRIWGGQTLEAVDCRMTYHNALADREAVEAHVPDRLTVPGNGPALLTILLLDCHSMTVGNESLQKDAWMYLTIVAVDDQDPSTEDAFTYLLDFGSDWDQAWKPLQERGASAFGGRFDHAVVADTDELTFAADGFSYMFRDTGDGATHIQRDPWQSTLLVGPNAETALQYSLHYTSYANLPISGILQLDGGMLSEIIGPAAPSVSGDALGGASLKEIPFS